MARFTAAARQSERAAETPSPRTGSLWRWDGGGFGSTHARESSRGRTGLRKAFMGGRAHIERIPRRGRHARSWLTGWWTESVRVEGAPGQ
jgi:hypothetical protein